MISQPLEGDRPPVVQGPENSTQAVSLYYVRSIPNKAELNSSIDGNYSETQAHLWLFDQVPMMALDA